LYPLLLRIDGYNFYTDLPQLVKRLKSTKQRGTRPLKTNSRKTTQRFRLVPGKRFICKSTSLESPTKVGPLCESFNSKLRDGFLNGICVPGKISRGVVRGNANAVWR
jgi:hypothetical protein